MGSEIYAALVGAAVGGAISTLAQFAVMAREKYVERVNRREYFRQVFLGLWLEVGKTKEFIDRLSEICDRAVKMRDSGEVANISLAMGVIVTNVEERVLSNEELYFMSRHTKDVNYSSVHRFLDTAKIMLNVSREFREQKLRLLDLLPGTQEGDALVIGEMSAEDFQKAQPTIVYLDMYCNMMIENMAKAKRYGEQAETTMRHVLKDSLGVSISG